jgi:hypothetical protein
MEIIPHHHTYGSGIVGFAKLVRLGFEKDNGAPAVFAKGCNVTFFLSDGEWEIDILLPNGKAIGVYATPDNVEVNT